MACLSLGRSPRSKPQIYTRRKLRPKRNDSSGTDKPHRQTRNTHSYQSTTTRVYNFRFYLKFHRIYMEPHLTLIQLRRHSTLTKPSIISLISNSDRDRNQQSPCPTTRRPTPISRPCRLRSRRTSSGGAKERAKGVSEVLRQLREQGVELDVEEEEEIVERDTELQANPSSPMVLVIQLPRTSR
jgi:hypothetical protein